MNITQHMDIVISGSPSSSDVEEYTGTNLFRPSRVSKASTSKIINVPHAARKSTLVRKQPQSAKKPVPFRNKRVQFAEEPTYTTLRELQEQKKDSRFLLNNLPPQPEPVIDEETRSSRKAFCMELIMSLMTTELKYEDVFGKPKEPEEPEELWAEDLEESEELWAEDLEEYEEPEDLEESEEPEDPEGAGDSKGPEYSEGPEDAEEPKNSGEPGVSEEDRQ